MLARLLSRVHRSSVAKDAYRIFSLQSLGLLFTLVTSVLIARVLGPEQKGLFDLYTLILSMITEFGLMGVPAGLLYFAMAKKMPLGLVHGTGIGMLLIATSVVALLLIFTKQFLLSFFPGIPPWAFYLLLLVIPAMFYMSIWSNLMIAQNKVVISQKFTTFFGGIYFTVVLILFTVDHLNFKVLIITSAVLSFSITLIAFRYLQNAGNQLNFDWFLARKSLSYGTAVFAGGIANYLHFKVDQIMINAWVGVEGVAFYALSTRWAEMLFLLDNAITTSALHRIGSLEVKESSRFTQKVMLLQFCANLIGALFLALFTIVGFEYLYGAEYSPSVFPLLILLPGVLFWSASKPMANFLSYRCKKGAMVSCVAATGLLLNILLNFLLIKKFAFGIIGAAIASSCSYFFVAFAVILMAFLQKDSKQ